MNMGCDVVGANGLFGNKSNIGITTIGKSVGVVVVLVVSISLGIIIMEGMIASGGMTMTEGDAVGVVVVVVVVAPLAVVGVVNGATLGCCNCGMIVSLSMLGGKVSIGMGDGGGDRLLITVVSFFAASLLVLVFNSVTLS